MEKLRQYFHVDMAVLLETDPEVAAWTTDCQPLPYLMGGRQLSFVPDIWVAERTGGHRAIRLVWSDDPEVRMSERNRCLAEEYRVRGVAFEVVTSGELAAHPRLKAAKHILFHRYWDCPGDLPLAVAAMAGDPPRTLGDLQQNLGGQEETWPQILSLVAQGRVEVDLGGGLGPETGVLACRMEGLA